MTVDKILTVRCELTRRDGPHHRFTLAIELEVPPGITLLVGPSGAGKTTTLAAIAGLVSPSRGRLAIGDELWFDASLSIDRPPHERRAALVFQSLALFPHLSALENVVYGVSKSLGAGERRLRALAMLERMKAAHVAARAPKTLSGGEAQRVALARAFAMEPRVLLLDEPFSALHRDLRRELQADVKRFAAETHLPVLLVTHHLDEAKAIADRAILLDEGKVKAAGPIAQINWADWGEAT